MLQNAPIAAIAPMLALYRASAGKKSSKKACNRHTGIMYYTDYLSNRCNLLKSIFGSLLVYQGRTA
jgi:hypothetical protein